MTRFPASSPFLAGWSRREQLSSSSAHRCPLLFQHQPVPTEGGPSVWLACPGPLPWALAGCLPLPRQHVAVLRTMFPVVRPYRAVLTGLWHLPLQSSRVVLTGGYAPRAARPGVCRHATTSASPMLTLLHLTPAPGPRSVPSQAGPPAFVPVHCSPPHAG